MPSATATKATAAKRAANLRRPLKLDIACGQRKLQGFKGIDIAPDSDADIVHDLMQFPWPIDTSSVKEASCSHFVEHIPHYRPEWKGVDGWWLFFDELWRVMKKGGIVNILHPYVMSGRAFWDPTHVRFIHEATWYYLDPEWRDMQKLDHYPTIANFEVLNINGNGLSDDHISRSAERQAMERNHYWNVVQDLAITLKARK